ncbi:site-2 protease family protein [Phytohabitans kaempferiae]|uniref:Zinc metalloprotease n=1 Tax=Phytohabitans kaempferiae TaxID=1620943 RepID=A0ABV6MB86_9ACTN
MRLSFRIGQIAGVPIGVNWSVLVVFLLITVGLSVSSLPGAYPGYPWWAYLLAGLCAAVVFLAGLLAHEVAHAVVATRNGLRVKQVTLWMLGGIAEVRGQARDPAAEARIVGVGPLVSFLIGVAFAVAVLVTALAGVGGLLVGVLLWLAVINLAIAVFNMLPAAPLDGGRLLKAALWTRFGDRARAAAIAARAGHVLGAVLIAFGVLVVLFGEAVSGVWLVLLGGFVSVAASAELRQSMVIEALAGVRVDEVMSTRPETVPPDMSVAEFDDKFLRRFRHSAFPVTERGRPVGLVTLDRVRQVPPERRAGTRVSDVACPTDQLPLTTPQEAVNDLLPRLNGCADERALVVRDDRLVGIVSTTDVSHAVQRRTLRRDEGRARVAVPVDEDRWLPILG